MHAKPRHASTARRRVLAVLGAMAVAVGGTGLVDGSPAHALATGITAAPNPILDCGPNGIWVSFHNLPLWNGTSEPGYPKLETPWENVVVPALSDRIELRDYASWDWYVGRENAITQPEEIWRVQVDFNNDGLPETQSGPTDDIPDGTATSPGYIVTGDFATTVAVPPGSTVRVRGSHASVAGWSVRVSGVCVRPLSPPTVTTSSLPTAATTTTSAATTTTPVATSTTTTPIAAALTTTTTTTVAGAPTSTVLDATTTTLNPGTTTIASPATTIAPRITTTTPVPNSNPPVIVLDPPTTITTMVLIALPLPASTSVVPVTVTTRPTTPPTTTAPPTTLIAKVAGVTVTQPTSTGPTASIDPSQTTDLGYTGAPSQAISTAAAVLLSLGLGLLVAAHASGPKRDRR